MADPTKPRPTMIPPGVILEIATVLTTGSSTAGNDRAFLDPSRGDDVYIDAMLRHLEAWRMGEECDPKSGYDHVSHIAANAVILLARRLRRIQIPPNGEYTKTV